MDQVALPSSGVNVVGNNFVKGLTRFAQFESALAYNTGVRQLFAGNGSSIGNRSLEDAIDAIVNDPRFLELCDEPGLSTNYHKLCGLSKTILFHIQTRLRNMRLRNKYISSPELPSTDQPLDPTVNQTS